MKRKSGFEQNYEKLIFIRDSHSPFRERESGGRGGKRESKCGGRRER